ncbi:MAG: hypothetical protein J6Q15_02190 [Clostridia bacterium]|nr:hypothetical protein [Clostridia bacterium]
MSVVGTDDAQILHIVQSYFGEGEKAYFAELLKSPKEMKLHQKLSQEDPQILCKKAVELINDIEQGKFNEVEMAEAEYMITHLLGAIDGMQKVNELELTKPNVKGNDTKPSKGKNYVNNHNNSNNIKNKEKPKKPKTPEIEYERVR